MGMMSGQIFQRLQEMRERMAVMFALKSWSLRG